MFFLTCSWVNEPCYMDVSDTIYQEIDLIIQKVDAYKKEPIFSNEKELRANLTAPDELNNDYLLKTFSHLIAYSQNANSALVEKVLSNGSFDKAFNGFIVDEVVKLNPCDIVDEHWMSIKSIRQQAKLFHIVSLARIIQQMGGLSEVIMNNSIPRRVKTSEDIDAFWKGFRDLHKRFQAEKIPFFQSTTSLLHFLMEIGYDCVKPDVVVMKVAKQLQIINDVDGVKNLRKVVQTIQHYSVSRGIRPSVVDLYFLIEGGQLGAKEFVRKKFYDKHNNK